jgi:hypothetical protein
MVILVPVIAGDSTIPKWVLAHVTSSRSRDGFLKQLRNGGLIRVALCVYFCFDTYIDLKKVDFVISDLNLWILLRLIALFGIAFVTVKSLFDGWRAYNWLDQHQKWNELAELQWYEPVILRRVPSWVTATIFLLLVLGFIVFFFPLRVLG